MKIGILMQKNIIVVITIKLQLKESDIKTKCLNYNSKIWVVLLSFESFREYSYIVIIKIII